MTDQPIGPNPIPEDMVRAMKTLRITNGPKAPDLPPTLGAMRDAARAVLAEINRLADELPPGVALSPTNIVKTAVKFIDPDGLALRLYESKREETGQ